jgi:hypothetical protein
MKRCNRLGLEDRVQIQVLAKRAFRHREALPLNDATIAQTVLFPVLFTKPLVATLGAFRARPRHRTGTRSH